MASDYSIGEIYQGGTDSFKPNYGDVFTGYSVPASSLGITTNPGVVTQIAELDKALRQGVVPIEVGVLRPDLFEAIPKEHFKEMKRMAKLTNAKISIHSPLVEPSGINEQSGIWSESQREAVEYQLKDVVEKAYEADHRGNIPITIHSTNIQGTQWKMTPEGKKVEKLAYVNRETGQTNAIGGDVMYTPGGKEVKIEDISPQKSLAIANDAEWSNNLRQIEFNRENAERIIQNTYPKFSELYLDVVQGKKSRENLSAQENEELNKIHFAGEYMEQAQLSANSAFNKAYKIAKEDDNKEVLGYLSKLSENYGESLGKDQEGRRTISSLDPKTQSAAMADLIKGLSIRDKEGKLAIAPRVLVPLEEFATKQSSKTFGNIAFEGFKKFGNKAPVISIENLYPNFAFSTGKEMNKLILESKKQFVENAKKEGYSKSEAEKNADRLIGLTFDVGHLNIHKKHGFTDKDLMEEFKAMAPHIKHLHLTDNFGSYDSHLPPGMGNVSTKEYLEELEKQGFKGRTIIEAAGAIPHFGGVFPYVPILEAFGAGMYQEGVGPYWNQSIGLQQGYSAGQGEILPQYHFETFGSGFSNLPTHLGGQRGGGAGGRMSGRPME